MSHRLGSLVVVVALGCAAGNKDVKPPTHEQLVNHHMQGDYAEVLRWCPRILDDRGAEPSLSDWCLFGYPAALRLSLDSARAELFMRTVCTDMAGAAQGDEAFRVFYVREVARWFALPMRLQKQDAQLDRAVYSTVAEFSAVCQVDPEAVYAGLDTQLPRRRARAQEP